MNSSDQPMSTTTTTSTSSSNRNRNQNQNKQKKEKVKHRSNKATSKANNKKDDTKQNNKQKEKKRVVLLDYTDHTNKFNKLYRKLRNSGHQVELYSIKNKNKTSKSKKSKSVSTKDPNEWLSLFQKDKTSSNNNNNNNNKDINLIIILGNPSSSSTWSTSLSNYLHDEYVEKHGGSLAFLYSSNQSNQPSQSSQGVLNEDFLKKYFGIQIQKNHVIRTSYHSHHYLHPKHVLISNNNNDGDGSGDGGVLHSDFLQNSKLNNYVYPNGVTIHIDPYSYRASHKNKKEKKEKTNLSSSSSCLTAILSTGPLSFPANKPIAAVWTKNNKNKKNGKVLVIGSSDIFNDQWIDQEDNHILCDMLLIDFFLSSEKQLFDHKKAIINQQILQLLDHEDKDYETSFHSPDIISLSRNIQSCLQKPKEEQDDPQDVLYNNHNDGDDNSDLHSNNNNPIHQLFQKNDSVMYQYNHFRHLPKILSLYKQFHVKHSKLSLILPELECPTPPLTLSIFTPNVTTTHSSHNTLTQPKLDLFDLDDHFADSHTKLEKLVHKCSCSSNTKNNEDNNDDLIYFVNEAKHIIRLGQESDPANNTNVMTFNNNNNNDISSKKDSIFEQMLMDGHNYDNEQYGKIILSVVFYKIAQHKLMMNRQHRELDPKRG